MAGGGEWEHSITGLKRLASALREEFTPAEALRHCDESDPVRLVPQVAAFLAQEFMLVDTDRTTRRVYAHLINRFASDSDATPTDGESWCGLRDELLRISVQAILDQDQEEERLGIPVEDIDARFDSLIAALAVERDLARLGLLKFNGLQYVSRQAFFELLINGKSIAQCIETGLGPRETLGVHLQEALAALYCKDEEEEREARR